MKTLSKRFISLVISLALVMCMLVTGMVSAAEAPAAAGTIKITGSVSGDGAEEINQVLEVSDITLSYKVADTIKATIKAVVAGMDFFTLRAEGDPSHLVFEIPQAMENSISLDFATFMPNMVSQAQALLEQMGLDLNELMSGTSSLPGTVSPVAEMSDEEIQDMIAPYLEIFSESIEKSTTVENGAQIELANLGTSVEGDLYTWAPTAEEFAEISGKLGNLLKEDDRLLVLYRQQLEQMRPMYDMFASMSADMTTEDLDEAYAQIYEVVDQLPDILTENADEIGAMLAELDLKVIVGVVEGRPVLVKIQGVNEGTAMECGFEDASASPDVKAAVFVKQGETGFSIIFDLSETETESVGTVDILMNGSPMGQITYNVSKTEKTRLGLPVMSFSFNLGGMLTLAIENVQETGKDVLSVDASGLSMFTGQNNIDGFHIEAAATDDDNTEDIESESIDISNSSIDEIAALFGQIGEGLSNYYNNL